MAAKPVINIDDVELAGWGNGDRFEARIGWVSPRLGARKLGYNIVSLAPGKTAWPYHFHHRNEEAFFVVEGTGVLRHDGKEYPLRAGDMVCCPPGSSSAHQITNDSDAELKYLAISTKEGPEVAQYPDSGKIGVLCGPDADNPDAPPLRAVFKADAGVDYWEGEE